MAWMTSHAAGHEHVHGAAAATSSGSAATMPGMATQQEIARLRTLSGRELDVYFLQLILRHHAGGAPMALDAAEHAGVATVRALANSIVSSQTAEMDSITAMLAQRGAQPLR